MTLASKKFVLIISCELLSSV